MLDENILQEVADYCIDGYRFKSDEDKAEALKKYRDFIQRYFGLMAKQNITFKDLVSSTAKRRIRDVLHKALEAPELSWAQLEDAADAIYADLVEK